jgi:hypothetical protein
MFYIAMVRMKRFLEDLACGEEGATIENVETEGSYGILARSVRAMVTYFSKSSKLSIDIRTPRSTHDFGRMHSSLFMA